MGRMSVLKKKRWDLLEKAVLNRGFFSGKYRSPEREKSRLFRIISGGSASTLIFISASYGLPKGATVVSGNVSIDTDPSRMIINQNTDKAILNWISFSIDRGELVRFNQPGIDSVVLNRVVGQDPSMILGQLIANGKVFLINPNGIIFGKSAVVDVAGLVATTLNISDEDFLAENYRFSQINDEDLSQIINRGEIKVSEGGFVILSAPSVLNEGLIYAKLGTVVLGSGTQFSFDFAGDGLVQYSVDAPVGEKVLGLEGDAVDTAVSNKGVIENDGGTILLTGDAVQQVFSSVVNNEGIVEASSLSIKDGRIVIEGNTGTVKNTGLIDVSAESDGKKGSISITGDTISNSGTIKADGSDNADAGDIYIYSDSLTELDKDSVIQAVGRGENSDGGFIEVSSKKEVKLGGQIYVYSENGKAGKVLVDPENLTISADYYSAGGDTLFEATNSITVDPNVTISTRNTGSPTADGAAPNDQLTSPSVGNSGNLELKAPNITIGSGAKLLTFADSGYTSGYLKLTATGTDTNITINSGAILKGGDITVSATSNAEDYFDPDTDTADVVLVDFLDQFQEYTVSGGRVNAKAVSKIDIKDQATLEGSNITVEASSTGTVSVEVRLNKTFVTYGTVESRSEVNIDGVIKSSGTVNIKSSSAENLTSHATAVNTGQRVTGEDLFVGLAYGKGDLISKVTVGSTAEVDGGTVNISSTGTKNVSVRGKGAAYEDGTLSGAVAIAQLSDTVETSVTGKVTSQTGSVSITSTLDVIKTETKTNAASGTGLLTPVTDTATYFEVKAVNKFIDKYVPLGEEEGGKEEFSFSISFTYLDTKSDVLSYIGSGGNVRSSLNVDVKSELKYQDNGVLSGASASVNNNDENKKEYSIAGVLNVVKTDETVKAYIGSDAVINLLGDLSVYSNIYIPHGYTPAYKDGILYDIGMGDFFEEVRSYIAEVAPNTLTLSSSGGDVVGAAGMVNIAVFKETSHAYIDTNASINQDETFVTAPRKVSVKAENHFEYFNYGGDVGGDFSGNDKTAVGGSYLGVYLTLDTQAYINDNVLLNAENLLVSSYTDLFLANVGVAGGFADEYGINGVFNYVSLNETTKAFVNQGSVLDIGTTPIDLNNNGILDADETESLVVNAVSRNRVLNASGGIVKSHSVGIGASVSINNITRNTEAYLSSTVYTEGNIGVSSKTEGWISAGSLAGTYTSPNKFKGIEEDDPLDGASLPNLFDEEAQDASKPQSGIAISGTSSVNLIDSKTKAYLDGAIISGGAVSAGNLDINAIDTSGIYATGGTVAVAKMSGNSAGLAGGFFGNYITTDVQSFVSSSDLSILSLSLKAEDSTVIMGVGAGGAVAINGEDKISTSLAGAVSKNRVTKNILSYIYSSSVSSSGNVFAEVVDSSELVSAAGDVSVSGYAAGAAIALNTVSGEEKTYIENSDVSADSISLKSENNINIKDISVSASASLEKLAAAASVSINEVSINSRSYIKGKKSSGVSAVNDISVKSVSSQNITIISGSVAVDKTFSGLGIGGSASYNNVNNQVDSYVESSSVSSSAGNLTVSANQDISSLTVSVNTQLSKVNVGVNLAVNNFNSFTRSYITDSYVDIFGSVAVLSTYTGNNEVYGGVVQGGSGGFGLGGSGIINIYENTTDAYIESSNVSGKGNKGVTHSNAEQNKADEVSSGVIVVADAREVEKVGSATATVGVGGALALDGSVSVDIFRNNTDAYISNSDINQNNSTDNIAQSVKVKAYSGVAVNVGNGGLNFGSNAGVGLSASILKIQNVTSSYIKGSNVNSKGGGVQITSRTFEDILTVSAAGSISKNISFAGSGNVIYLESSNSSYIEKSTVKSEGNLDVVAEDTVKVGDKDQDGNYDAGAVAGSVSVGGTTVGVGGSVNLVNIKNKTHAYIIGSTTDSISTTNVSATSDKLISMYAANVAASATAGIGGSVNILIVSSDTKALIGADDSGNGSSVNSSFRGSTQAVNISSTDKTDYKGGVGSGEVSKLIAAGGAVDVAIINVKNRAYVGENSNIRADNSIGISSYTENKVDSTVIAFGGGLGGVAGSVSVSNIGKAFDADQDEATGDIGGSIDNSINTYTDLDSGNQDVNNDLTDAKAGLSVSDTVDPGASFESVTASFVGKNSYLSSGSGGIRINATESTVMSSVVGAIAGGAVGVSGSVSVQKNYANIFSYADTGSVLSSTGNISLNAYKTVGAGLNTYAGSGGGVTLGAAVSYLYLGGDIYSFLGDSVQVTDTSELSLKSQEVNSADVRAYGTHAGVAVAGGAASKVVLESNVHSYTGRGVKVGSSSDKNKVQKVSITTDTDSTIKASAVPVNVGAVSAQAAVVDILYRTNVRSYTGVENEFYTSGLFEIGSKVSYEIYGSTTGVNLGGATAGASVTTIEVSPDVKTYLSDRNTVDAKDVSIYAKIEDPSNESTSGSVYVEAKSSASAGGGLLGANASVSTINNKASIEAYIGSASTIKYENSLNLESYLKGRTYSYATGIGVGFVGMGASVTGNVSQIDISTGIRSDSNVYSDNGIFSLNAYSLYGSKAESVAGSGGVVAGNVSVAKNEIYGTNRTYIDSSSKLKGKEGSISSDRNIEFNSFADSKNASVLGMSGAFSEDYVHDSHSKIDIGSGASIEAYSLSIEAKNRHSKEASGWFGSKNNSEAGSGGVFSGAASFASTILKNINAQVNINSGASLSLLGNPTNFYNLERMLIEAYGNININTDAKLSAGGTLVGAKSEAKVEAEEGIGSSVNIGDNVQMQVNGNLTIASSTSGKASAKAKTNTYGLAASGQGKSKASLVVNDSINVNSGTEIRVFGDANLVAGKDSGGGGYIDTYANTDVYNKTAFAYNGTPDADAKSVKTASIRINSGSSLKTGRDINLSAEKGSLYAYGYGKATDASREAIESIASTLSETFGGDEVSLDIISGSSVKTGFGNIELNGLVETGLYRHVYVTFGDGMDPGFYIEEDTDSAGNVVSNLVPNWVEYENGNWNVYDKDGNYIKTLTPDEQSEIGIDWEILRDIRIATSLDKQIEELKNLRNLYPELAQDIDATIATLEGQKTDPATNQTTHIIKLKDIVASSGNISVRADNLYGTGRLNAPGDVKIEIRNRSPLPVEVGQIEIPKDYGGNIEFNGKKVSSTSEIVLINNNKALPVNLAVQDAQNSEPPSILIESTYAKSFAGTDSTGKAFYKYPPPILVGPVDAISANDDSVSVSGDSPTGTKAVSNFAGSVTIVNNNGSIFVTEDIFANTITISAGGNFVFNNPELVFNVAYSPESYFSSLHDYAKGQISADAEGTVSSDTDNNLQTDYDTLIAGTSDHSNKYLLAGNNIFINAEVINVNGLIQSGIPYKDVTITDDMINNAIASGNYTLFNGEEQYDAARDLFVGKYNVTINPDEKKVYVSGLDITGGTVFLSGKIANTGGGKINVLDGFGRININNQSSYELVLDSINTGNIEGKVTIVDKLKDNGTGKFLVTEIKRIGNEIRVYTNQGVDSNQATVLTATTVGRTTSYSPFSGLRYYWMDGYTTSNYVLTEYYKEFGKFLGFIPISEREFTNSDIVEGYPIEKTLDNSDIDSGFVQGFMRDADGNIIVNPPDYNLDKTITTDYSYTITEDYSGSYWDFLTRKTWIKRITHYYEGKTTKFYSSVKADYPIEIVFTGEDVGEININSSTNVILRGEVTNIGGSVNITTGGSLYLDSLAPINASAININAPGSVGTADNPIRVSGDPVVSVSANLNGVYLDAISSNIFVSTGINTAGDLRIRSDKGMVIVGLLKGKNIHLEAVDGQITSGNPSDPYINIDTDIDNNGKLYMTAAGGNIYVREVTGDLSIDTVSTLGDVYIQVPSGSLVDGNPNENVDERTALELELLYNDLGLQGLSAQQLRDQQIDAYKQSMEIEYDKYWREYRDLKLNPDGTYSYTPYEPVEFRFSPEEVEALKSQGWTDQMISDYEQDLTDKYNTWGQSDYDPNFSYIPTQAELDKLTANEWTDDQLSNTLPASLFNKNIVDTEYKIEEPNIIGKNVTIITSGSIGKDKKENIVFYYNDTDRYTQTELDEIKRALVAAERPDIEIDTENEVIIIKQRDDIDIEAFGSIQAIAGSSVYIGSEFNVNISSIYSRDNWVRIKTGEGIYSVSPGLNVDAPEGLIIEASNGPIGTEINPVSVSVGEDATVTARAAGDINLLVPYGDLNIDYIYSRGDVNLTVPNGSIIDFYSDSIEDITSRSVTLTAGVYGGLPGSYDNALDINLTDENGKISLYGYGSFNIYKENSILFGDINIGGDLTPRTFGDITFTSKAAANSIEIDIPGSITVNEDTGIATVTGLIFKSNNGKIDIKSSISSNGYISLISDEGIFSSGRMYSSGAMILKTPGDIRFDGDSGAGSGTSLFMEAGNSIHLDSKGGYFAPEVTINAGDSFYTNSSISGNTIDIDVGLDFTADVYGYIRGYSYLDINAGGFFTAKNGLSAKGDLTLRSGNDMVLTGFLIGDNVDITSGGSFTAESDLYISSISSVNISAVDDIYLGMKTTSRGEINLTGNNITVVSTVQSVEEIDFVEPEFNLELDLNNLIDLINENRTGIVQYLENGFNIEQVLQKSEDIYANHSTFLGLISSDFGIYAQVKGFLFNNGDPTTTLSNIPAAGQTGSRLVINNPVQKVSYTPPTVIVNPSDTDRINISALNDVTVDTAILSTGNVDITGQNIYVKGLAGGKYLNIEAGKGIEIGEHTLLHGVFSTEIISPEEIKGSQVAIATNGEMNISAPVIDLEGFVFAFNNVNPTIKQITDYLDPILNLEYILDILDMNPSVDASIKITGGESIDFKGAIVSTGGVDISSKDISMTSVTAGNYVSITSPSSITIGNDSVVYGVTTIDVDAGGDLSIDGFLGNNGIVTLNSGGDVLIKGSAVSIADLPLDLDTIIDAAGKLTAGDVYSAIVDFAGTYNPSDSNGVFLNAPDGDITISGNFVSTATAKFTTNNVYISGTAGAKNFVAEVPGDFVTEERSIVYNLGKQIIDVEGYVKIGGYLSGTGEVRISSDKDVTVSGYILSVGNVPFTIDDLVRVVGSGNVDLPYEKVKNFEGEFNALNNNTIDIYAKGKVDVTGYILTMADVTLKAEDTLNIDHVVLGNSVTLESPNDIPVKDNTIIASYDFVNINTPSDVQVGGTVATNGSASINGNNVLISGKILSNDKLPINLSDYIKQALDMTPDGLFNELKDDAYNLTGNDINTVDVNAKGYVDITGGIVSNARVNIDAGSFLNVGGIGVVTVNGANLKAGDTVSVNSVVKATEKDVIITSGSDMLLNGAIFGFTDVSLNSEGNLTAEDKTAVFGGNSVSVNSDKDLIYRGFTGSKDTVNISAGNDINLKGYLSVYPEFEFEHELFTETTDPSDLYDRVSGLASVYSFKDTGSVSVISRGGSTIISGSVLSSNKLYLEGNGVFVTGVVGGYDLDIKSPQILVSGSNSVIYEVKDQEITSNGDIIIGGYLGTHGDIKVSSGSNVTVNGYMISNDTQATDIDELFRITDGDGSVIVQKGKQLMKDYADSISDTGEGTVLISSEGFTDVTGGIMSSSKIGITSDKVFISGLGAVTEDSLIIKSRKNVELYSGVKALKGYVDISANDRIVKVGGPREIDDLDIEAVETALYGTNGIGSPSDPITVKTDKISAVSENGGIFIDIYGNSYAENISAESGDIGINLFEGDMSFTRIVADKGRIDITVKDGGLTGVNDPYISAGGDIFINAKFIDYKDSGPIKLSLKENIFVVDLESDDWMFDLTQPVPEWIVFNKTLYGGRKLDVVMEALTSTTVPPEEEILNIIEEGNIIEPEMEREEDIINFSQLEPVW